MPNGHKLGPMDLRHLRTFLTVAEQGTVSKASLRLRIAQPALSRQIMELEEELGLRLFDRVRRRLVLTGEGEQLLGDCRAVFGAVGSFSERAQRLRRADTGILKSRPHHKRWKVCFPHSCIDTPNAGRMCKSG